MDYLPGTLNRGTASALLLTQPTVERAAFRDAMSCVAASVHLVTTNGPAGRRGVTVTSVCSVSDDPATLLVCLNEASANNRLFVENGVFAVNVLPLSGEPVARAFAGQGGLTVEERFAAGTFTTLITGAPILAGALASFDCRIIDARVVATHRILIGSVVALEKGPNDRSLLYRDRAYHSL